MCLDFYIIASAPGPHHVVIVADGGGVEEGGHGHHHRHRPDGRHRGRGAAQRQVRGPGPRDRHVPAVIDSNVLYHREEANYRTCILWIFSCLLMSRIESAVYAVSKAWFKLLNMI